MEVISIPYFGLIWTGIGFLIMLIGFFIMVHVEYEKTDYTGIEDKRTKEVFEYFLEEEKKNQLQAQNQIIDRATHLSNTQSSNKEEVHFYNEMIQLYEEGKSVEEIAKKLGKGKGEIQLMLSLYAMR